MLLVLSGVNVFNMALSEVETLGLISRLLVAAFAAASLQFREAFSALPAVRVSLKL